MKDSASLKHKNRRAVLTEGKSDFPFSGALGTSEVELDLTTVGIVGRGGSDFCDKNLDMVVCGGAPSGSGKHQGRNH